MRSNAPTVTTWRQEGSALEDARALYQDQYNGRDFRIEPIPEQPFSYRMTSVGDDELTLRSNTVHGAMRGTYMVTGEYLVTWFTGGGGVLDAGREPVAMTVGAPVVSVRDRPSRFEVVDHRQSLVHVGAVYLEGIAASRGEAGGPLRFDTTASPDAAATARWMAAIAASAQVLHRPDANPLLVGEAKRAAAEALLRAFPHDAVTDGPQLLLARHARVRRAVEFIRANAHLPITITEIADAAGLSARGTQDAFQRTVQATPLAYLRSVRLERVREELLGAAGDGATVAEMARRWGFAHLGRFAGLYGERFGEAPSTTLRRRR